MKKLFCLSLSLLGLSLFSWNAQSQSGFVNPTPSPRSGYVNGDNQDYPIDVHPPRHRGTCFQRTYSAEHLANHPRQLVTAIEWYIPADTEINNFAFKVQMKVRSRFQQNYPQWWKNSGKCTDSANGNEVVNCSSDSGSFVKISGRRGHVTFEIPNGKAFAAVSTTSDSRVVLDGNDEENRSLWLFPADCNDLNIYQQEN